VLDRVELHEGFGFARWFRSDELAVGVEVELMKRARQTVVFELSAAAEVCALMGYVVRYRDNP
jgi:hypothetical protein